MRRVAFAVGVHPRRCFATSRRVLLLKALDTVDSILRISSPSYLFPASGPAIEVQPLMDSNGWREIVERRAVVVAQWQELQKAIEEGIIKPHAPTNCVGGAPTAKDEAHTTPPSTSGEEGTNNQPGGNMKQPELLDCFTAVVWREYWDSWLARPYYHHLRSNRISFVIPPNFPTRFPAFWMKRGDKVNFGLGNKKEDAEGSAEQKPQLNICKSSVRDDVTVFVTEKDEKYVTRLQLDEYGPLVCVFFHDEFHKRLLSQIAQRQKRVKDHVASAVEGSTKDLKFDDAHVDYASLSLKKRVALYGSAGLLLYLIVHNVFLASFFTLLYGFDVDITACARWLGFNVLPQSDGASVWVLFFIAVAVNKGFVPVHLLITLALAPRAAPKLQPAAQAMSTMIRNLMKRVNS